MKKAVSLENKTVLITGSGENIGKAIAEKFFIEGYSVVVNDIDQEKEKNFSLEIRNSKRFYFSTGDISSLPYQKNLINETLSKFSEIDILINNAGVGSGKGFFDMEPRNMEKSIKTNLVAPFFLSQKVSKHMIEKQTKGSIIFISSIHRKIPCGNVDYSASKRALGMITKELAFDLGPYGIRVNGIALGRITRGRMPDERIPLEKASGTFEEIAKTALFLTDNDLSGYITGEILTVDGGLSLTFER